MRYVLIFLLMCFVALAQSTINEDTVHFVGQASAFTVGSNLVTDGGFPSFDNWTQGTWSLASGGAAEDNAGTNSDLTQTLTGLTDGRVYRIQFEVTTYTDGNVTARFDNVELGDKTSTGVFTGYAVCTGTTADLDIRADATFTGSVDNVSVVAWVGCLDAAGGCTIAAFTGTLTDYMTATGGALASILPGNCDADEGTGHFVRLIDSTTSPFADALVGQLIKIDFTDDNHIDGTYEITAVTDDDTIIIDLDYVGDETCYAWLGGAHPDIATAIADSSTLSEDPDGKYRKRYICVNVGQMVDAVTDFIAESSEDDLRMDDGSRKLIGFYDSISTSVSHSSYRIVSDMDEGGYYYAGAWESFKCGEAFCSVRPNGKLISWNAKGNSINILELNTSNFEIRNFKLHNTAIGGTNAILHSDDAAIYSPVFENCWFGTADEMALTDAQGSFYGTYFIDCYFDNSIVLNDHLELGRTTYINNILNGKGNSWVVENMGVTAFCMGNLFYKGADGIEDVHVLGFVGNTFYGQTESCVYMAVGTHSVIVMNNIFSPAAAADVALEVVSTGGSIIGGSKNNIFYSAAAGAILTNPIVHSEITPNPPLPAGSIELDPLFVNAADGDFRLRPQSPALNSGFGGLFNGRSTIGSWGSFAMPKPGMRSRYRGSDLYRY